MAFNDCFYIKRTSGAADRSINITVAPELFTQEYPVDWSYGVEKVDGSEPDWVLLTSGNNVIPMPLNKKIYLKGNASCSTVDSNNDTYIPQHLLFQVEEVIDLAVGGNPQSLIWDGDGTNSNIKYTEDGERIYIYTGLITFYSDTSSTTGSIDVFDLRLARKAGPCYYNMMLVGGGGAFPHRNFSPDLLKNTIEADDYAFYYGFSGGMSIEKADIGLKKLTGEGVLGYAFYLDSSLNEIRVNFTEWREDLHATTNWVKRVAPTGTFYCPESLPQIFDDSHIPVGWTVETFPDPKAPAKPISVTICNKISKPGRKV